MPRYNVEYNGKWACFSSISDGFITEFMKKQVYEEWRKEQYGVAPYEPAEKRNLMAMKEAVFLASINRTRDEWIECLKDCGLPQSEIDQLIYDCDTKYYVPIPDETKGYKCPNCSRSVEKKQEVCRGEDCELKFVWRK